MTAGPRAAAPTDVLTSAAVAIIAAGVRVIRIVSEPPVSGGSTDSRAGSAALAHGAAVPARARARRAAR